MIWIVKRFAEGISTTRNSIPASSRPLRKYGSRVSRSSRAMTSVARCTRHSASARSSSGRLEARPLSTLGDLFDHAPAMIEKAADRRALSLQAETTDALLLRADAKIYHRLASDSRA